jgi:hypothetical protein
VTRTRLALGAYAKPWPGEVHITDDAGGSDLARLGQPAVLGELTAAISPGSIFVWDDDHTVELILYSGHLSSRDEAEVLAGANRIAIETDAGGWEIIGFAGAELAAPRTYRLTRLLRGQGGTDHAMGTASPGRRVMVLDGKVTTLAVPPSWLDTTAELRSFAGAGDGVGATSEVNIDRAAIIPLRPVHLMAKRLAGDDVALSWVRRSRADSDSWAMEDAPLDWVPEAYRVEIYDGGDVVRSADRSSPSLIYSAGQQVADFGAPPASFAFKVAQLSGPYGPGHWAEGEFNA